MSLILASQSPRRQELLSRITTDFVVIPSHAQEIETGTPQEQVIASARVKARTVGEVHPGIVLGADTVVVLSEHVMGKPCSREEAAAMLLRLSDRTHLVLTGMHLWDTESGEVRELCVQTEVRFRAISDDELAWYLDSGEYADKAGAYAIQGRAAVFVASIAGEYTNVMGLPLCALSGLLRELGVAL
jgi:septum formation protein